MEPRRRTHLVNELMDEATLMQSALQTSLQAQQTSGQTESPGAYRLREEYASWERVLQGLKVIQAELNRIEHAERERRDRASGG
jgi:hypothetical protein